MPKLIDAKILFNPIYTNDTKHFYTSKYLTQIQQTNTQQQAQINVVLNDLLPAVENMKIYKSHSLQLLTIP